MKSTEKNNDCGEALSGQILVFTGPGKGKTTSAVGQIIRALGHGLKAKFVCFFKGDQSRFPRGTIKILEQLDVPVRNFVRAHPDLGKVTREEARAECRAGISYLEEFFSSKGDKFDLLVLDEINVALSSGFINVEEFVSLLRAKPPTLEVVCTGRGAPAGLIEVADLVSRIEDKKHFYDQGLVQRAGFEY